jgi:hypothetical protein
MFSQHQIQHAVGRPLYFYREERKANEDIVNEDQEMRKEEAEVQQVITIVQKEER